MLSENQSRYIAGSAEFQKIIDNDAHLSALLNSDGDRHFELLNIFEMLGGVMVIGRLTIQPITPALWSFLWGIENNYTRDIKKITEADTNIFLYLLEHGIRQLQCPVTELAAISSGTIERSGLTMPEAAAELLEMIYQTFRPLELLPGTQHTGEIAFDAFWLARLISVVSTETGETSKDILFNMPLSACLYSYAASYAKDNPRMVFKRQNADKNKQIAEYIMHLAEVFCAENEVI